MRRKRLICAAVLIAAALALGGCGLFNTSPVASFTVGYGVDPDDPLWVTLDASDSADPDLDALVAYLWTFGDDVEIEPAAYTSSQTASVIDVRYPLAGTYHVTLAVRDEHGLTSAPVAQDLTVPPE